MKAQCLLVSGQAESFYDIGKEKSDVVCKKMKNRKNVCYFLFAAKGGSEE
jgi:hypothetical protein